MRLLNLIIISSLVFAAPVFAQQELPDLGTQSDRGEEIDDTGFSTRTVVFLVIGVLVASFALRKDSDRGDPPPGGGNSSCLSESLTAPHPCTAR